MSYVRIDAVEYDAGPPEVLAEPANISFYYKVEDMFNNIFLKTTYRAKNIRDTANEAQVDDFAMSEDEKDAFTLFLRTAVHDAFNKVMKMTTGVDDALILNENESDVTGEGTSEEKVFGFRVKDHSAYNENNLFLVDDGVKNLIESYIMREWWEMVGNEAEMTKADVKYKEVKRDLVTKRLFQLRKPFIN